MKNSNALEDLKLPDWSVMRDPHRPISPMTAFKLCEEYYELFPDAAKRWRKLRREKCTVEFVLD
ncbi:MAG: hypothetical protein ABI042_01255 [Verrucomicrobiota bacterium]